MLGLIGKKIGMTQVFDEEGTAIPVSVIHAGPCPVVQVKTVEKDGYNAVQLAFEGRSPDDRTFQEIGPTSLPPYTGVQGGQPGGV